MPDMRAPSETNYETCVVLMLGHPGAGKRTVGSHLVDMLDGVLVDNQLINIPLLTLFKWDGKFPIPTEIWDRVVPIREAVYGTIEDLAPETNSYVLTTVLRASDSSSADHYDRIRKLAQRRGSLFLAVELWCDADEIANRVDNPDRVQRLKGSDPEGYRRFREMVEMFDPPAEEAIHLDSTTAAPQANAEVIYQELVARGLSTPA